MPVTCDSNPGTSEACARIAFTTSGNAGFSFSSGVASASLSSGMDIKTARPSCDGIGIN